MSQSSEAHSQRKLTGIHKSNDTKASFVRINSADSIDFRSLPGIGVKYSSRMVRYRQLLGGFHSKKQLLEVYGIDSVLYEQISPYLLLEPQHLRKINVNTCTVKKLKSHPYISNSVAKLMVKYREHHGFYERLEELQDLPLIDEQLFRKIVVYLEID